MRLDQLEALVHERRRVDRDLRPHRPRRVSERLRRRDVRELRLRPPTERPPRGGEHQGLHLLCPPSLEALEGRRVLRVDRKDPPPSPLLGREGELAGRDEALLVGEREIDPGLQRGKGRRKTGEADDRVQHDVRLARRDQLVERRAPADRHVLHAALGRDAPAPPLRATRRRPRTARARGERRRSRGPASRSSLSRRGVRSVSCRLQCAYRAPRPSRVK